ncbi:MAG TPA: hypothetical protein VKU19_37495 [Bryobacteraceae bacterium]|nr:hypothetical protein [Bryobacteraceae bacterium]
MGLALQVISYLIAIPLELLAIAGMLRGPYRRYPFLFVYIIVDFLTAVVEMRVNLPFIAGNKTLEHIMVRYYWIDDAILEVLVYAAVISLIYYATATLQSRRVMRLSLIVFAVLFAGISFLIHYVPDLDRLGVWMTPWSSNLSFCAAILDLALWAILIASREKDRQLLMLSGALGIQFTGVAIGQSLRNLSQRSHSFFILYTGNGVLVLTNIAFLYILWQAFRKPRARVAGVQK